MAKNNIPMDTTGWPALDEAVTGLLAGDSLLWHVGGDDQYRRLAQPFAEAAKQDGRTLVYFRFAAHKRLLPEGFCDEYVLDPQEGVELFLHRILEVISRRGRGVYYVFDCFSAIRANWTSDSMLGNLLLLICPRILSNGAVAYLALQRGRHSNQALQPVTKAATLFLEVYEHEGILYLLPVKARDRYSPTLHLMREWDAGNTFPIVRSSARITEVLQHALHLQAPANDHDILLRRARECLRENRAWQAAEDGTQTETPEAAGLKSQLISLLVTRDAAMLPLVEQYLTLQDVLDIYRRLGGTGLIGGKAVGMLTARKIIEKENPRLGDKLEAHDSFYIGSDIFYNFLVRNGIWDIREKQHSPDTFLDGADEARDRIWNGKFADHEIRLFEKILDYFGQYPIIVRSSSLLEDNYGNSFAGKYDSVFCANQCSREERLREFIDAIRAIYASSMSREALLYRERNGLLKYDEQMALLVMRVTGEWQNTAFYPHLAGVGFSFNPFVWGPDIDAHAGVVRLVYGLGTRAVDRVDDDYTRVVALSAPLRRPEGSMDEIVRHTQRKVDYIDLTAGKLTTGSFHDLAPEASPVLDLFTGETREGGRFLTFNGLLTETPFVDDLRDILSTLQRVYGKPVDIEFAINFSPDAQRYWINLLQCRPLQVQGTHNPDVPQVDAADKQVVLAGSGAVVGHSRVEHLDWLIAVRPDVYGLLPEARRHQVARAIGRLNQAIAGRNNPRVLALAPGRWGTHMASLGVPVIFSEISRMAAICEVMEMHDHLTPDVSLGTHFFGELVEMNMLYFAIYPGRPGNRIEWAAFTALPNHLDEWDDTLANLADVIHLVRAIDIHPSGLHLIADTPSGRVVITPEPSIPPPTG